MSATLLYRIASTLLLLFAAGHTYGFLNFKPPTPEALAVRDAMYGVHFAVRGADLSYGGFYTGFGFSITVYLLFSAYLCWHLGTLAREQRQAVGALGWALTAVQIASVVLAVQYFSVAPAMLSALVALCVAWAAWRVQVADRAR